MADFVRALRSMPMRGAPPTPGAQPQSFGPTAPPNAAAVAAQAPAGPQPGMGEQMAGPSPDQIFEEMLMSASAGVGPPPQAAPPAGAPPGVQGMPPAGVSAPTPPGMPPSGAGVAGQTPQEMGITPPNLMITPLDSTFRQQFYAQYQRFPGPKDISDRQFVADFVTRVGRLPTKLEYTIQTMPQHPLDGPQEWT